MVVTTAALCCSEKDGRVLPLFFALEEAACAVLVRPRTPRYAPFPCRAAPPFVSLFAEMTESHKASSTRSTNVLDVPFIFRGRRMWPLAKKSASGA